MKAGIGYGNEQSAYASGKRTAEIALRAGDITRPDLVIAFCGGRVDPHAYVQGLRAAVGDGAPIIGGSAVGVITNDHLSYEGYPAGAAILQSDRLRVAVASAGSVDKDERRAGSTVSGQVVCTEQSKLFLFFYDSIKAAPTGTKPPIMNASPRLIQGVDDVLQGCVPIIGAGVVGDFQFSPTTQFCGYSVGSQQVVGALLGGDVAPYYRIMHGCTPMDGIYHRITRIDGAVIYEVDGKPVVDMIDELYGDRHWREQRPVKRLTIGVNLGDKFGAYREGNYVNRLIMGVLPAGEGIVIFEPDLSNGTEILFMLRDSEKMMESVRENSTSLLDTVAADGKRPAFALYIDCAGRAASFSETLTEEALEIRNTCNRHEVPLLGFYSGVEVAPLLGKSRGLDWTGVLLVLAEG